MEGAGETTNVEAITAESLSGNNSWNVDTPNRQNNSLQCVRRKWPKSWAYTCLEILEELWT